MSDMDHLFPSLEGKSIVEIGVGYGGQCAGLSRRWGLARYTLGGIAEPLRLARRYLEALAIPNLAVAPLRDLSPPADLGLVAVAYGFGGAGGGGSGGGWGGAGSGGDPAGGAGRGSRARGADDGAPWRQQFRRRRAGVPGRCGSGRGQPPVHAGALSRLAVGRPRDGRRF